MKMKMKGDVVCNGVILETLTVISCSKCGNLGEISTCPFDSELMKKETACDCCKSCRKACYENI